MAELGGVGNIQATNTFGAQSLVSRHTAATNASVFYTFDERGNVAQRLDAGGIVLSTDLYDAFGARTVTPAVNTAPAGDPWGFGAQWGYQTDAETGLVLCTNRFYDPQQGRFLTRDPLGYDGGVNLYSYTQNNPVNGNDPLGLATSDPECMRRLAEIIALSAELDRRFSEMLTDQYDLYGKKDLPGRLKCGGPDNTTWEGHQNKYEQEYDKLERLLAEYKRKNCGSKFPVPKPVKVHAPEPPKEPWPRPFMNWPSPIHKGRLPVWLPFPLPVWAW